MRSSLTPTPQFHDQIDDLCRRVMLTLDRDPTSRITFAFLKNLPELSTCSDLVLKDAFIMQLVLLELKNELAIPETQPKSSLKQKTEYLLTSYLWNKDFIQEARERKLEDLVKFSQELNHIIRKEIIPQHAKSYKKQLQDMELNLKEFLKKSAYTKHELIHQLQNLITQKNNFAQLENFLSVLQSQLNTYYPSKTVYAWNAFTGFFANRFSKPGAYQAEISFYNHLLECEAILKHHIQKIKQHPCHIIAFSETEIEAPKEKISFVSLSLGGEKKSPESSDEKTDLVESKEIKIQHTHLSKSKPYYTALHSIPTVSENISKPRATYSMKSGNQIKHYSNTSDDKEGNKGAFADIIQSISQAEHIIFIAGWLFEPQYHFPRKTSGSKTLGEILIDRAIAYPKLEIAILVWRQFNPPTPDNKRFAFLRAYHNNAAAYLKQLAIARGLKDLPSNLQIRYVRRTGVSWSHHQKFLVVDSAVEGCTNKREWTAYYGSADLAGGKFDWHEHPILDTKENKDIVSTIFRDARIYRPATLDFNPKKPEITYQNTPRLPWREVLSQAKGPIAQDLMTEFVNRWSANSQGAFSSCVGSEDNEQRVLHRYIQIRKEHMLDYEITPSESKKHKPIWDAQLVRSAESSMYASQWKLKKNYEKSIHKAHLQAIYQAEKFIYIETQYLTGMEKNRVPLALVNRIVEQHQAGKPFHVFIILPLLPNGDAGGKVFVEPLRYLQWKTMRWMMEQIEARTGVFWGNYLSFNFLGQWLRRHWEYQSKFNDPKILRPELITFSGHASIYIHSKLMIVDDKVIINGSANLTERSLAGPYDSELAVYQKPSLGCEDACIQEARQFRREIWEQYFGQDCLNALEEKGFENPERLENIAIIRKHARNNLTNFMSGKQATDAKSGHLLTWPFKLKKGCVGEMEEGCDFLPDTLLTDMQNETEIFKWFPTNESKPTALKVAGVLKHKGFS